jgi:hypothetical protein
MSKKVEFGDKVMIYVADWDDKGYYYGIVEPRNVNRLGDYQLQVCDVHTWEPINRKLNFREHEIKTIYAKFNYQTIEMISNELKRYFPEYDWVLYKKDWVDTMLWSFNGRVFWFPIVQWTQMINGKDHLVWGFR